MIMKAHNSKQRLSNEELRSGERGAALATAILMLGLLSVIAMTVLAVVQTEARVAGSDLDRMQAFYAAASGIEKMTSDFSTLFSRTSRPTTTQLNNIAASPPDLSSEGFTFTQSLALDSATLTAMQATQNITNGAYPTVTVGNGPLVGLTASVAPYTLTTTATSATAQVNLTRQMNNYLVPIFQFGMFSDEDMEIHPGPDFTFNGRVHANGNLYINGNVTFLDKVTTAKEVVRDVLRNGATHTGTVTFNSGPLAVGSASVVLGPNVGGNDPSSPTGTVNSSWKSSSVAAFGGQLLSQSTGIAPLLLPLQLDGNQTREIIKRRMPNDDVTLSDSRYHSKAEIRILLDDESPSSTDSSGIPSGQGVVLSTFDPVTLPNATPSSSPTANGGGRALWRVNENNTSVSNSYNETSTSFVQQQQNGTAVQADTARSTRVPVLKSITGAAITTISSTTYIQITCASHGYSNGDVVFISGVLGATNANGEYTIGNVTTNNFTLNTPRPTTLPSTYTANTGTVYKLSKSTNGAVIPFGAGISGRILIQIVDSTGTARDVTTQILSMGVTEGEPNAIVALQRPLWAAYTQGSRDSSGSTNPAFNGDSAYTNCLTDILSKTHIGGDGEIQVTGGNPVQDSTNGYLTSILDDTAAGTNPIRADIPAGSGWNSMVPINLYNVREGRINTSLAANTIFERGMTSIVELNMRNIARWVDGVYDNNLLAGTNAVSTNIGAPDGYIVYVSDRRGDKVKSEVDTSGATINTSNGMCDNEDIYGPNGSLDPGEDVIDFGAKKNTLQKDTTELPDPAVLSGASTTASTMAERTARANVIATWNNPSLFRRAVRIFNGEDLIISGGTNKLSATKGITVSSENMVYIWGNYNTTGIDSAPPAGQSCLNETPAPCLYTGDQVPASIVCDAFFPLSKTWFDSVSGIYPDNQSNRPADRNMGGVVTLETSLRAGIIAGNNKSALSASSSSGPDAGNWSATTDDNESRLNGGMHNFPRFLENWGGRYNLVGSLIPLYHSTQAMGQYSANSTIYGAPVRNWAFDSTFRHPDRLPPGTPQFQYIEPTAFRQLQ
jgi:Tfp pilus assembly protein PilX